MKRACVFFLLAFISWFSYSCDKFGVEKLVENKRGKVVRIFETELLASKGVIFFHYLNADDEHPDLKVSYAPDICNPESNAIFDSFPYDGDVAHIESLFWGRGKYKSNLFVIVSWVYNLDGVNTVGKYYSVFVYDYKKTWQKNNKLTSIFGSGHEGFVDGKAVRYRFKSAKDVWDYLKFKQ